MSTQPEDIRVPVDAGRTSRRRRGLSAKEWVILIVAAVYILSPVDVIPEIFLGPLGLTDDVVAFAILAKLGWSAFQPAKESEGAS